MAERTSAERTEEMRNLRDEALSEGATTDEVNSLVASVNGVDQVGTQHIREATPQDRREVNEQFPVEEEENEEAEERPEEEAEEETNGSDERPEPVKRTRPFIPSDGAGAAEALRQGARQADRYAEARNTYGRGAFTDLGINNMASDMNEFMHIDVTGLFGGPEADPDFDPTSNEWEPLKENLSEPMRERFNQEAVNPDHARDLAQRLEDEQEVYRKASTSPGGAFMAGMMSTMTDPVAAGSAAVTLGASAKIHALTSAVRMSSRARAATAATEIIGSTAAEAGVYAGLKSMANDNYTAEDAQTEMGYAMALGAPLAGIGGGLSFAAARKSKLAAREAMEADEAVTDVNYAADAARTGGAPNISANRIAQALDKDRIESMARDATDEEFGFGRYRTEDTPTKRDDRRTKKYNDALARNRDNITNEEVSSMLYDMEFNRSVGDAKAAVDQMVEENSKGAALKTIKSLSPSDRLTFIKASMLRKAQDENLTPDAREAAENELAKIERGDSVWNERVQNEAYWEPPEQAESRARAQVREAMEEGENELDAVERLLDEEEVEQWQGVRKTHRQDYHAIGRKSPSSTSRKAQYKLLNDPISKTGDGQPLAADAFSQAHAAGAVENTNRSLVPRVKRLLRKRNVNPFNVIRKEDEQNQIGSELFDIILTGRKTGDQDMDEAADLIRDRMAQSFNLAKRYGVEGTEGIEASPNYMPRLYNRPALHRKLAEGAEGREQVMSAFTNAIRAQDETLPKAAARVIAEGMVKTLRRDDTNGLDDIFRDKDQLRDMMRDIAEEQKAPGETADEHLARVFEVLEERKAEGGSAKGKTPDVIERFKPRADIDVFARSDDGQFAVRDIIEDNAFIVSEQYAREMAGEAAMARAGWKSPSQLRKTREQIEGELNSKLDDPHEVQKELDRFDDAVSMVKNRPIHFKGMSAKQKAAMSTALQYSSAVHLGMAGLAGAAEFVGATFRGGAAVALRAIPTLRGKSSANIAAAIERQGVSVDNQYYGMWFNHYEETGLYGTSSFAARLGHQATKAVGTVSLMRGFDAFARRTLWTSALDISARNARKKGTLHFTKEELGLTKSEYDRVIHHLQNSVDVKRGVFTDEINDIRFEKWLDENGEMEQGLVDTFLSGMYKMSSNQTLRVLSGERIRMIENPIGQFLFQFQTLLLSGIYKSLGNKVANVKDVHQWMTMMGEIVGGTLWYQARNQIKMAGMSDMEKKEHRREHLEGTKGLMGGLGYTTSFGGVFSLYNKASAPFGLPAFGQRYAASPTDAIFSNPTLDMAMGGASVIGDVAQLKADERTAQDAMQLAPLKSWYPVYYINNKLMEE